MLGIRPLRRISSAPSPIAAPSVAGITFADFWDFTAASNGRVPNSIAPTRPLIVSDSANVFDDVPFFPPSKRPALTNGQNWTSADASWNNGDFGFVAVCRFAGLSPLVIGANGWFYFRASNTTQTVQVNDFGTGFSSSAFAPANQWGVYVGRIGGGTGLSLIWANQRGGGTTSVPTSATRTALALRGPEFQGQVAAYGHFNMTGAMTNPQVASLSRHLYQAFMVSPAPNRIWLDGDSQTSGVGLTNWKSTIPGQLTASLGGNWGVTTYAVPSSTTGDAATYAVDRIDPYLSAGKNEVVCIWIGTNSLAVGDSPATVYAAIQAYCAARKSAASAVGGSVRVIVVDCIPSRSDVNITTAANTLNASLSADFPTATGNARLFAKTSATYADYLVKASSSFVLTDGIHIDAATAASIAVAIGAGATV